MTILHQLAFSPISNTTAPGFSEFVDSTSVSFALESTSLREFEGRGLISRTVRISNLSLDDYFVNFGDSNIVAASSDSILCPGGAVHIFSLISNDSHIAMVSSTDVNVNVVLGVGGK